MLLIFRKIQPKHFMPYFRQTWKSTEFHGMRLKSLTIRRAHAQRHVTVSNTSVLGCGQGKPVSQTVKNCANTTIVKAKVNRSRSAGKGGNTVLYDFVFYDNKGKLVKIHDVGHNKSSEKYCDSITDICHANWFKVLQTFDSNGVDTNECISPVVEDASNIDCQSDDSVKTDNVKQGGQKSKKFSLKSNENCQRFVSKHKSNVKSDLTFLTPSHKVNPTINKLT